MYKISSVQGQISFMALQVRSSIHLNIYRTVFIVICVACIHHTNTQIWYFTGFFTLPIFNLTILIIFQKIHSYIFPKNVVMCKPQSIGVDTGHLETCFWLKTADCGILYGLPVTLTMYILLWNMWSLLFFLCRNMVITYLFIQCQLFYFLWWSCFISILKL